MEQKEKTTKIWIGWPANRSRSGTKKQKRGFINDLDSLKNDLWNAILAKKSKKTPKRHPIIGPFFMSQKRKKKGKQRERFSPINSRTSLFSEISEQPVLHIRVRYDKNESYDMVLPSLPRPTTFHFHHNNSHHDVRRLFYIS